MIDPQVGKTYIIRLTSGALVPARFNGRVERGYSRKVWHYRFVNLNSGRDIELKSLVKIKREIPSD